MNDLVEGQNILEVKTCTDYTYTFVIFVSSGNSLTNIALSYNGGNSITCSPNPFNAATHDYDCSAHEIAITYTQLDIIPTLSGSATATM